MAKWVLLRRFPVGTSYAIASQEQQAHYPACSLCGCYAWGWAIYLKVEEEG